MINTLKRFLTQQFIFARPPLSLAVAHPLPLAGEGVITAARGFNPLSRLRERVGVRGAISICLSIAKKAKYAK
jgi:hypothetical protein